MGPMAEGLWDCSQCGTKGILARHRECSGCGKPRSEGIKFYLPQHYSFLSEAETTAADARRPADWLCARCNCYNNSRRETCESCGAGRGADSKVYPAGSKG